MSIARVALSELKRMTAGILPKLVLIAMACIPLLYGGIYLYANWDPYGSVDEVPAALVMQDQGATDSDGNQVNTGEEVRKNLEDSADFDWHDVSTRDEAVDAVTSGEYEFALVIPENFSENLQSTGSFKPDENGNTGEIDPQSAGIEVITNDANNYILTNIVTKAGTSIRDTVASQVGDQTANTLLASFTTIHSSVQDAADGASELSDGTVELADAIDQVKDGTATLSSGTITLKDGTSQLKDGSDELVDGQQQLADGSAELSDGAGTLATGAASANDGAKQLAEGAQTLKSSLETAAVGASDLSEGANTLYSGSQTLAAGTQSLADGAEQLYSGSQTLSDGADSLASGTQGLSDGAASLAAGTSALNTKLSESGLSGFSSTLTQVCSDLSAAENSSSGAADLTSSITAQISEDLKTNLAPLVADGTLTQEQVDQLIAQMSGEQAQARLTEVNQQALDSVAGQLSSLGSSCGTDGTSTIATDIDDLTGAVSQINDGAQSVASGASSVNSGAQSVASGAQALEDNMGTLSSGASSVNSGAQSLESGASSLATGAATLASGADQLAAGSSTLADGANTLSSGTGQLATGSSTLATAAGTLAAGEQTALDGQKSLNSGVTQVDDGASELQSGASELDSGVGQIQSGASQLEDGADELSTGLSDGVKQIPSLSESDQNKVADVMSDPVKLGETSLASGSNYGEGMGPFFLVLALWIGALMLVQTMRPSNNRALASSTPSMRVVLGSWGPFAVVGFLQTVLLYAVVRWGLGFDFAHPWLVFFFLALVSLVYTALIYGLVALFEAPGKLLALIVLIIQLVTSGGMMPYETLPKSIEWLHFVLPMGYALSGLRRLAYGIDLGAVGTDIMVLLLWGAIGLFMGLLGTMKSRTWNLKKLNPEITV